MMPTSSLVRKSLIMVYKVVFGAVTFRRGKKPVQLGEVKLLKLLPGY